MIVEDSVFEENRIGMAPNSQEIERLAPQRESIIRNNVIRNNGEQYNPDLEAMPQSNNPDGIGVMVSGSQGNIVENNEISGHIVGVLIRDNDGYVAEGNRVEGNSFEGNDLPFKIETQGSNCVTNNSYEPGITIEEPCALLDSLSGE